MTALALILSFVLLLITALHVYWGIGGIWPGKDQASCARAVVGFHGVDEMPSAGASFAVAACLALATLWPLALEGVFASPFPREGLATTALLIGLVFIGRGVAGFTPWWRRLAPEQPFARLDRLYYSPLCLLIGLGFAVLAISEFSA
ncbi:MULTISPECIES: DUF3995 domain-containing protein [unclassified Mesorhizobium]|uniref:DUF3995 domain-containing protein n=1 Tax=unclassified Mesorhizobium TaxID=325217 RepID=UPI0009611FD6|nr:MULTISPECIES: DUF3995 domain-containing protein [unclassified Mesorhizobium]MBN9258768.1 DUF3995 domain-containing protein [Mesorhizobium sp.]OJX83315.1 MAG: hypothetical protein BGO93_02430 [Mesorhizobium sp. 65-26]